MESMLDEVCAYLNNYFVVKPFGIHRDKFAVENGGISMPFLQVGQYFRILGSVFNDGVYMYPAAELNEEIFDGEIWAMAVPPAVIALTSEIEAWQTKNGDINSNNMSPYTSESFANYSYTKAQGGNRQGSGSNNAATTWKDVYGSRLNRWRKI